MAPAPKPALIVSTRAAAPNKNGIMGNITGKVEVKSLPIQEPVIATIKRISVPGGVATQIIEKSVVSAIAKSSPKNGIDDPFIVE